MDSATSWLWDYVLMAPQFIHLVVTSGLYCLLTCGLACRMGSSTLGYSCQNCYSSPALNCSFPSHTHLHPIFSVSAKVPPSTQLLVQTHRAWYWLRFFSHSTCKQGRGLPSGHILGSPLLSTSTMAPRSNSSSIHLVYLLPLLSSFSLCSCIGFWKYKSVHAMLLF